MESRAAIDNHAASGLTGVGPEAEPAMSQVQRELRRVLELR